MWQTNGEDSKRAYNNIEFIFVWTLKRVCLIWIIANETFPHASAVHWKIPCTETYGLEKYGRFSIVRVRTICTWPHMGHVQITRWNIWTSNVVRRRGNCNLLNKLCDNWLDVHFYSINVLKIYAKSVHSIPRMRIRPLLRPYFSTSRCFATTFLIKTTLLCGSK